MTVSIQALQVPFIHEYYLLIFNRNFPSRISIFLLQPHHSVVQPAQ